jgi:hypothetical protein
VQTARRTVHIVSLVLLCLSCGEENPTNERLSPPMNLVAYPGGVSVELEWQGNNEEENFMGYVVFASRERAPADTGSEEAVVTDSDGSLPTLRDEEMEPGAEVFRYTVRRDAQLRGLENGQGYYFSVSSMTRDGYIGTPGQVVFAVPRWEGTDTVDPGGRMNAQVGASLSYVTTNGGGTAGTALVARDASVGIQDLGYHADWKYARTMPEAGYVSERPLPAAAGHVFAVRVTVRIGDQTRLDYAKIRITSLGGAGEMVYRWARQLGGQREI